MIDLPFSLPFFQWLLFEEHVLTTGDLRNIDPTIATTVTQLEGIVRKKRRLEEDTKMTPTERQAQIKSLTMDGCPIEDLGLDFTLPGYAGIELRKGGKDLAVTIENLPQVFFTILIIQMFILFQLKKIIFRKKVPNIYKNDYFLFCYY